MSPPALLAEIHPGRHRRDHAEPAASHERAAAPAWGLSQKLSRAIGPYREREGSFAAQWVSAEQAAAWGFVNRVVPAKALPDTTRAPALEMLGAVPEVLAHYKAVSRDGYALPYGEALALERQRGRAFNTRLAPGDIKGRRESVRERNRQG